MGLAIEAWKISKAVTVSFEGGRIEWAEASWYKKSNTKKYDEIATSYLLFVTMPLVAGFSTRGIRGGTCGISTPSPRKENYNTCS